MARFTRRGFLKALGTVTAACAVSALPLPKAEAREVQVVAVRVTKTWAPGHPPTRFDVLLGVATIRPDYAIRVVDVD